jgi:hypothetical protein
MFSSIYHFFSCVQFLTTIYQFSRKQFNVFYQNAQSITVEGWETFGPDGRLAPRGIDWRKVPRIPVFVFFPVASTKRCLTEYGFSWPNQPIPKSKHKNGFSAKNEKTLQPMRTDNSLRIKSYEHEEKRKKSSKIYDFHMYSFWKFYIIIDIQELWKSFNLGYDGQHLKAFLNKKNCKMFNRWCKNGAFWQLCNAILVMRSKNQKFQHLFRFSFSFNLR